MRTVGVDLLTSTLEDRCPHPIKPLGLWDLGTSLPLHRSINLAHDTLHNRWSVCGFMTEPYLRVYPPPIGLGAWSLLGQAHKGT